MNKFVEIENNLSHRIDIYTSQNIDVKNNPVLISINSKDAEKIETSFNKIFLTIKFSKEIIWSGWIFTNAKFILENIDGEVKLIYKNFTIPSYKRKIYTSIEVENNFTDTESLFSNKYIWGIIFLIIILLVFLKN